MMVALTWWTCSIKQFLTQLSTTVCASGLSEAFSNPQWNNQIPYSGKLSREKIFTNFAVLWKEIPSHGYNFHDHHKMKQSSRYLLVYKPVKKSLFGYKMQVMNESCVKWLWIGEMRPTPKWVASPQNVHQQTLHLD